MKKIQEMSAVIKLNGAEKPYRQTLGDILAEHQYAPGRIAVLVNGEIIKKELWAAFLLKPGDAIDVVSFVGGG
jgi:sulfur carrier protein